MNLTSTERWYAIIGLGFVVWLVPFTLDLALLPLQVLNGLVERLTYCALLALCAGICGWMLLQQSVNPLVVARQLAGTWFVLALLLDYPARWLTAVPRPGLLAYGIEFALPLIAIPLVVLCCGLVRQHRRPIANSEHIAAVPRYLRRN